MSRPRRPPPVALLSVFFPMWNEQDYVERAVRAAEDECQRLQGLGEIGDYELVIVDDCSTDDTAAIAQRLAAADPHVRVVHHEVNRGLGGSIKTGFDSVRGDVVLYTDADLPFEMLELGRALRVLRHYEADMVSAYRLDRTGEGPRRAVYSFVYNSLVQAVFGTRVRDVNFAFKLVRRHVLDAARPVSEGSFIDAELVIRAQRLGFHIVQIGVDYFPRTRGISTLSSASTIRRMLSDMLRLRVTRTPRGLTSTPVTVTWDDTVDACYLDLASEAGDAHHQLTLDNPVRDHAQVILDFDAAGRLKGLELLGCAQLPHRMTRGSQPT